MSYAHYLFMVDLVILVIAIGWTLAVLTSLKSSYNLHILYNWFKHPGMKYSFISYTIAHITMGIAIWYTALSSNPNGYIFFILFIFGIKFYILSIMFGIIGQRELKLKWKIKVEKKKRWEQ